MHPGQVRWGGGRSLLRGRGGNISRVSSPQTGRFCSQVQGLHPHDHCLCTRDCFLTACASGQALAGWKWLVKISPMLLSQSRDVLMGPGAWGWSRGAGWFSFRKIPSCPILSHAEPLHKPFLIHKVRALSPCQLHAIHVNSAYRAGAERGSGQGWPADPLQSQVAI